MTLLATRRLALRHFRRDDAAFVLELVNDPAWLRFIGDRNVHSLADAEGYIEKGPLTSYRQHGHGLYLVELARERTPIGMCGLMRREGLDAPDLGFALLGSFRGQGYARESAAAVLEYGHGELGLARIAAIVMPENERSIAVLESLGFGFERRVRLPNQTDDIALYAHSSTAGAAASGSELLPGQRSRRPRSAPSTSIDEGSTIPSASSRAFTFRVHGERLAIARLPADAGLPAWSRGSFVTVSRTPSELSIVCAQEHVPAGVVHERDRIALGIEGTIAMTTVGVLAALCGALATASVPVFVISTYDTDWLLVASERFDAARAALERAGHRVEGRCPP